MRDPLSYGNRKMKAKKRKDRKEEPEGPHRTPTMELKIERSPDGGFIGVDGRASIKILEGANVCEGQTWRCNVGNLPIGRIAIPVEIISEAVSLDETDGSVQDVSEESCASADVADHPVRTETASGEDPRDNEILRLKKEKDELSHKVDDLLRKNAKLSLEVEKIPFLEGKVKDKKAANNSLIKQVKQLESKCRMNEIEMLTNERDHLQELCRTKDEKIQELKEIIELYQSESRSNSHAISTYLIGDTGIHCNYLEDGAYRVYFSPGKRTLRFIPDSEGSVVSVGREVVLPGISRYTGFEKIRRLDASVEGDQVLIALG